jgi:hypothetical protein
MALSLAAAVLLMGCRHKPVQEPNSAEQAVEYAVRAKTTDSAFFWLNRAIPSFGGLYRDAEGAVRVKLMDVTQADAAKPLIESYLRKTEMTEQTDPTKVLRVAFEPAQLTWYDLDDYKAALRDVVTLPDVAYLDADEKCNCITIAISSNTARSAVQKFVNASEVPASAVSIILTSPISLMTSLNDQFRPVKGGIKIKNDVGPFAFLGFSGICTQAATATIAGVSGLITNSHCTRIQGGVEGSPFFQAGTVPFSLDFIATETIDPAWSPLLPGCPTGQLCRFSDAAFAAFNAPGVGALGKLARPKSMCIGTTPCSLDLVNASDELTIVGTGGVPLVGSLLNKIGRTTGWTAGGVTATCVTVPQVRPGAKAGTNTALCQHIVGAASGPGDSGSPVFLLLQGNRAVFFGILWGGTGTTFVYSPITAIETELGVPTLVDIPPPPSATQPVPVTCEQGCQKARDACMRDVAGPHGPRPQQCAQEFTICRADCRRF